MAIEVTGKFKPKSGKTFSIVDAVDVEMPDGSRLSDFKGGVTSVNGQTGDVKITVTDGKDGADGKDGINGKDGANGKDGVSPSVSVEAMEGGHRITITDATGTKTFDVMDGEDGQGASITVDSELSETSENPVQNKAITANFNSAMQILQMQVVPNLLPAVTASDNGKALGVVNGVWTPIAVSIPTDSHINELIDAYLSEALGGDY